MRLCRFLFLGFFIALNSLSCTRGSQPIIDRVVVQVNDHTMTAGQFANELAARLREYDALMVKDPTVLSKSKDEIINQFVIRVITQAWAKERQIFVRKEDLDEQVQKVRSSYPDDLAFRRALAEEGIGFDDWREKLKFSLLQRLVHKELSKALESPSDTEIKSYYDNHKDEFKKPEEIRIRQIVLDNEMNAKLVLEELKNGKNLESLARKFSIAPEAASGGDVGWVQKGTLDTFDVAFGMKQGQKSRILKSAYGYHILEVTGRRGPRQEDLAEVREKIRRLLKEKREQAHFSAWLETQVRNTKVLRDNELIAKIKVETRKD